MLRITSCGLSAALLVCLVACAPAQAPSGATPETSAVGSPQAHSAKPIDANAIASATGAKPEVFEDVVKVSFPRTDVSVEVDGWSSMPPFMGLTSWAGFVPGAKPGIEAMVMGDIVVFEDEVNSVMSTA